MSVSGFIPTVWHARIFAAFRRSYVFGQRNIINRDFEGEITGKGDRVKIGGIGPITIKPYTRNTNIDDPEVLDEDQQFLIIDQADYFNFAVDDVDAAQAAVRLLDGAIAEAAVGMANEADQYIASLWSGVDPGNVIPATGLGTPSKAYEWIVDVGVRLDEEDVPADGRFIIIPPFFHGLLQKDDRFVKTGSSSSDATLRNGQVGEAAGFTVLKSNNVAVAGGDYKAIGGVASAWSFADQISKTEAFRPEKRFSDAVKGLHVYGAKITRPKGLAVLEIPVPGS